MLNERIFEVVAFPLKHPLPPSFAQMLDAEQAAHTRFEAACRASDEVGLSRRATDEEHAEWKASNAAHEKAFAALMSRIPTSASELIALLDLFDKREGHSLDAPHGGMIADLFCGARAFLDPDRYFGEPDPVDALWVDWREKNINFSAYTATMSEEQTSRFHDEVIGIERRIEALPPTAMRAAASVLCELWHSTSFVDHLTSPESVVASDMRDDIERLAVIVLSGVRSQLSGAIRRCVDDMLDNPLQRFADSLLHRPIAPAVHLEAAE